MSGGLPLRLALVGLGRMGQAIEALAPSRGSEIVARLDATRMTQALMTDDLGGAQVAIEFTTPEAALPNVERLLAAGCPVVIGTTGWTAALGRVTQAIQRYGVPALWSPNFSVGVQLFLGIAEAAARSARAVPGMDVHLVETHHTAKRDAPSGTALAIAERVEAGLGRPVGVTSIRVGAVPGTHEVILDGPFEQLRLVHEARDRRVFADGALMAARWLAGGRAPALYSMQDVLGFPGPSTT